MISYYFHKLGGWIMFVVVIIVFLIGLQVVQRVKQGLGVVSPPVAQSKTTPPPATPPASGAQATAAPTTTNPTPAPVIAAGPTPAEIRGQLQVARDRLVEATVHVDNALQSISDWNSQIPPLLTTTAGDNIAAHEDLVESLTKIVNAKRTQESELQRKAKRIGTLRSDLGKRATSSTPTALTSIEQEEIDVLEATVSVADRKWTDALNDARAVKFVADERVRPGKNRSLEDEIKLKTAKNRLVDLEEQREQEKASEAQEAEAKREQEKLAADREREKQRLAANRKEEAKAAAEKKRLEEVALLARARSAEVQSTLAIFLYKRDVQPQKSGGGSVKFVSVFDSQPMSYSALMRIGALAPTTDGLKWLARVGGNRRLSAPRWGVASQPGNWSEDDKKLLQEAQQLLRELGPILVDDGKLSP